MAEARTQLEGCRGIGWDGEDIGGYRLAWEDQGVRYRHEALRARAYKDMEEQLASVARGFCYRYTAARFQPAAR
jgi:hypothetical protein